MERPLHALPSATLKPSATSKKGVLVMLGSFMRRRAF